MVTDKFFKAPRQSSVSPFATLTHCYVCVMQILRFFSILFDITFGIAPESNEAKVPHEKTLTLTN